VLGEARLLLRRLRRVPVSPTSSVTHQRVGGFGAACACGSRANAPRTVASRTIEAASRERGIAKLQFRPVAAGGGQQPDL
jgi:hypothetical protein